MLCQLYCLQSLTANLGSHGFVPLSRWLLASLRAKLGSFMANLASFLGSFQIEFLYFQQLDGFEPHFLAFFQRRH